MDYLSNQGVVGTYMSRDGGVTWSEIRKSRTLYAIGDHGGIVLFVENSIDDSTYTNTIYYTLDEGATIQSFVFTDEPVAPLYITASPPFIGRTFILNTKDRISYRLDFSHLHPRMCTSEDYVKWKPSNGTGSFCVLGRQITYLRRNQTANCYNDYNTSHIASVETCPCGWADYECDDGWIEKSTNPLVCTPDPNRLLKPCIPGSIYHESQGYQLTISTGCQGGLNLLPITKTCPGSNVQHIIIT